MFALQGSSPFSSPELGHSNMNQMIELELNQLVAAPCLNPHYHMVAKYLDTLNRYMDIMAPHGVHGIRQWLAHVQGCTRQLQKRLFQGLPLQPVERAAVANFAVYWRNQIGLPEAQIVLIALTEAASM